MLGTVPGTKGERTRERILDAAERCFAARGFDAASLREIAREAGVQQPGLYNYFDSKQALYAAVLERAWAPMAEAIEARLEDANATRAMAELPAVMTDLLAAHPEMAALFHRALADGAGTGGRREADPVQRWLDALFERGLAAAKAAGRRRVDRAELAVRVIAMFNLCTGYFLCQGAFERMASGSLLEPKNVARQKALLTAFSRAALRA